MPASLWRSRDYLALTVGETISAFGGAAATFAAPLVILAFTGSALHAGLFGAAGAIGSLLFSPIGGVVVDRSNRRTLMLVGTALRLLVWATLAALVSGGTYDVVVFVGLGAVGGCAAALYRIAEAGAIKAIVPKTQLPSAISVLEARGAATDLAGAPLGGLLLGLGLAAPLWVNAATFTLALVGILFIRGDLEVRSAVPHSFRSSLSDGFKFVLVRPAMRSILYAHSLINLAVNGYLFTMVISLRREGLAYWMVGLFPASVGLGLLAGSMIAPRMLRRSSVGVVMIASTAVSAVMMALVTVWHSSYVFIVIATVMGFLAAPAANAASGSYFAAVAPTEFQGRVSAIEDFLSQALVPAAILIAAGFLDVSGHVSALVFFTSLGLLATAVVAGSRFVRRLPRLDEVAELS